MILMTKLNLIIFPVELAFVVFADLLLIGREIFIANVNGSNLPSNIDTSLTLLTAIFYMKMA